MLTSLVIMTHSTIILLGLSSHSCLISIMNNLERRLQFRQKTIVQTIRYIYQQQRTNENVIELGVDGY